MSLALRHRSLDTLPSPDQARCCRLTSPAAVLFIPLCTSSHELPHRLIFSVQSIYRRALAVVQSPCRRSFVVATSIARSHIIIVVIVCIFSMTYTPFRWPMPALLRSPVCFQQILYPPSMSTHQSALRTFIQLLLLHSKSGCCSQLFSPPPCVANLLIDCYSRGIAGDLNFSPPPPSIIQLAI